MRKLIVAAAIAGVGMAGGVGIASAHGPEVGCNGLAATIVGTDGDDEIIGTDEADVIVGLDGNDAIFGFGENDTICAGAGDDEVFGDDFLPEGGGADTIFGENGNDFVVGLSGADTLHGGNGNDIAIGGPGNDVINGDRGDDVVMGAFGNDTLTGGLGNDFLNGDMPFPVPPPQEEVPPGAHQDPTPNNSDSCHGGSGLDASTFCETESGVEEHPDPADVIIDG